MLYLIPDMVGGTQTYAEGLIRGLAGLDTPHEYLLCVSREAADLPLTSHANFQRIVCPVNATNRAKRYIWEQTRFPLELRRRGINLVHSLGYVGPVAAPCQKVVSIHDLNYLGHGQNMSVGRQRLLGQIIPVVARSADRILALSSFSRDQIIQHLGIPPEKVTVTFAGPRESELISPESIGSLLHRYQLESPYVLAFSSKSPHKNMEGLLQAWSRLNQCIPHKLVLLGHSPEGSDLRQTIKRLDLESSVRLTGYVQDSHVMPLMRAASLFVFPSYYEGFGLPALDAQAVGTPLSCARAASLPEIAGEGSLYFDPGNHEEMADTILRILTDTLLQSRLREQGYANVSRYSWKKTAAIAAKVYDEVGKSENN